MDKAKAAVSDFMQKAGHHDTTVHEKVAPAVVNEQVIKQRHEEAQTAIDREVHQDHYHTSVQPVKDREILPEQHHHRMAAVEERELQHGDSNAIKARLEEERMQFQNTRTEAGTKETHSVAPVIAGEHVHHHVHETIQPVIQKETIQPSVVHTTVPIHEVHQNEAKHHAASALPAVSMADFKKQGGSLTGREERYDGFEGEPRAVGGALGGGSATTGTSSYDNTGLDSSRGTSGYDNTGTSGYDNTNTTGKKPGLMDKLNPMKDSDGDGKRGVGN
ncbi:hypothetical protein HO173_010887 [Letharia columbiana]|uniref:Allergen n=1 Tax=Letharia columbiana TaxID=112416 RepID=A0A8H6FLZ0_9LECA|nr:uncharacterized protein HO173_010887 [Letharia columbiana]KAF6230979.1 hypothetical protein HO173_010887 [Letharia columbiana]